MEKYIFFIESKPYEKLLEGESLCVKDKLYKNKEPHKTTVEKITEQRDFHAELSEKYSLSEIADGKTDFEKALQLMQWLTDNTYYNGTQHKMLTDSTLDILNYSVGKGFSRALNCRYKAIALSDLLVAVGLRAYPVCMQSTEYTSNHFTCRVYLSEFDKWCMLDPSFNCWFSEKDGMPLDQYEVRDLFLKGKEPQLHGYSFNGTERAKEVYIHSFVEQSLSNLTTWDDNSVNGRDSKSFSKRKQFNSVVAK